MTEIPKNWAQVAWNHVRFLCPKSWQPVEVGQRYLVLEDRDGPVMEVKWGPVKGHFSHEAQLKNLASMHKKKLSRTLEPCPLPDRWGRHLGDFDASGFSWQGSDTGAKGVLIHCPQCGRATILQFFKDGAVPARVLESFRDHVDDGLVPWSLFDIKALVPGRFELVSHAFLAGKFSLSFVGESRKLYLYRYSPASVLLTRNGLAGFARATFPEWEEEPFTSSYLGCEAVGYFRAPGPGFKGLMARMSPKPSCTMARVWHMEEQNRILAVILEGKAPDPDLFEQVCTHYEIV
ncbi:MAG: hypothetical protein JEZ02_19520 [Desulfatibacillum sp.]|nr:hypothetical protein [Desulfatibacillum sp.]